MRTIYQQAATTFVWLGKTENSQDGDWIYYDLSVEMIKRLLRAAVATGETPNSGTFLQSRPKPPLREFGLPNEFDIRWTWFFTVLKQPYFRRMWIVQEVAVSSETLVIVGSEAVPWQSFIIAVQTALKFHCNLRLDLKDLRHPLMVDSTRLMQRSSKGISLLSLLLLFKEYLATDPRDKIFALCGLASDAGEGKLDVKCDYNLSTEQVFTMIIVNILKNTHSLDILSLPRTVSPSLALPSWVPDWTGGPFPSSLLIPPNYDTPKYDGTKRYATSRDHLCSPIFRSEHQELGLEGYIYDTVVSVSEPMNDGTRPNERQKQMDLAFVLDTYSLNFSHQHLLRTWEEFALINSHQKYTTGETMHEVFWQTIYGGRLPLQDIPKIIKSANQNFRVWRIPTKLNIHHSPKAYALVMHVLKLPTHIATVVGVWLKIKDPLPKMTLAVNRRLFKTRTGLLGLATKDIGIGDEIALVKGGRLPLVLRPDEGRKKLVGDCYVHGVSVGEVFKDDECQVLWLV